MNGDIKIMLNMFIKAEAKLIDLTAESLHGSIYSNKQKNNLFYAFIKETTNQLI